MTDVSVVIAFRDLGCPHRRRSFAYVRTWYEQTGWEIIVEPGDPGREFSRAAAINAAVSRASGRVIIQADPDSILAFPLALVVAALDAGHNPRLVIPHDRYLYLTGQATADLCQTPAADLYASNPGDLPRPGPADCESWGPAGSGNVVVFSRDTWRRAGRFDERFGMWGGDDAAFRYAAEAFTGPTRRLPGDMIHLWHPRLPQSVPGHPGYARQFEILAQYRDAAEAGPQAVRELVNMR